jgi:hypothetical protein
MAERPWSDPFGSLIPEPISLGLSLPTPYGGETVIKELDTVVLAEDLPEHGLKQGDIGTVVLLHGNAGYEVEFMTLDGETIAVVSLTSRQVRPVGRREIAQARLVETV